jgi:hypothetical protein
LIEYNTFTQNHDEFPDAPTTDASGGEGVFIAVGSSTNFTILENVVDGNDVECTVAGGCSPNGYVPPGKSSGCNASNNPAACWVSPISTTSGSYCPIYYRAPMLTDGIETHAPGGTYQDNYLYYHTGQGLYAANINGSAITAVTGAFSSTAAGQAMTVKNTVTGPFIHLNDLDGVTLNYVSGGSNFAGTFTFSDLRSQSNSGYGFEWTMNGTTPGTVTLNWGSPSAACLTGNTSGAVGTMPTGYSGPTSTTTCP